MLSKLLKYDFRALAKYGKPMLFVVLGGIVVGMLNAWGTGALALHVFSRTEPSFLARFSLIISVLLDVVIIFALFAALFAIFVVVLVHFYRSLVTDEGYLTFTLPVKASEILLSKLISGITWQLIFMFLAIVGSLAIVAFGVGMSVILPAAQAGELAALTQGFADTLAELRMVFGEILGMSSIYTAVAWILSLLCGTVYGQLLYCTVIFFASVVSKRNRVLVSIGCILGAHFVNNIFNGVVSLFTELFSIVIANSMSTFMGLTATFSTLFYIGMSVLLFFLTKYMMEKKLNLP